MHPNIPNGPQLLVHYFPFIGTNCYLGFIYQSALEKLFDYTRACLNYGSNQSNILGYNQ